MEWVRQAVPGLEAKTAPSFKLGAVFSSRVLQSVEGCHVGVGSRPLNYTEHRMMKPPLGRSDFNPLGRRAPNRVGLVRFPRPRWTRMDHAITNQKFLYRTESAVATELECKFKSLRDAAQDELVGLNRLLDELHLGSSPEDCERLGQSAMDIVWAGVAETFVGSSLDCILGGKPGDTRFITKIELQRYWDEPERLPKAAADVGLSLEDGLVAVDTTLSVLCKAATWEGAPEFFQDDVLHQVTCHADEFHVISRASLMPT